LLRSTAIRLRGCAANPIHTEERTLRQSSLIRPGYSERFRCIGPACEDSCCQGWAVIVDQPAYERYQTVPAGPLRTLLDANIVLTPGDPNPAAFAKIVMPASLQCPMLTEERLCRIHAELGEEFLCHTCKTYPRVAYSIDNLEEKALSLSCPEAARLVLLDPELLTATSSSTYEITWDDSPQRERKLLLYFWPIREFVFTLLRNRVYPLWQRLFLLGSFCRRLDAVVSGEADRGVAAVLRDFPAAVASGKLRGAMETIPADLALQLDMVLQLAGLCRDRAVVGPRFIECLEAFKSGIRATPDAAMKDLIAGYAAAHASHYAPFFDAHPYILENLLANTIFRRQFPFGLKDGKLAAEPATAREFALLATQFALLKGLLIGVAGYYKEEFSTAHVIHTVQSATKHFEHHPQFLEKVHQLLVSTGRDNPHGLTMLLRN
jgi:lysine-N-methylase